MSQDTEKTKMDEGFIEMERVTILINTVKKLLSEIGFNFELLFKLL